MDTQTTRDCTCAVSIHRQFEDGRFDFGLAGRIRVLGIERLVRTCRVFANISLFSVVKTVFSYLFALAERAFQCNQSHYVSSLKLLDNPDRMKYIDFLIESQYNSSCKDCTTISRRDRVPNLWMRLYVSP